MRAALWPRFAFSGEESCFMDFLDRSARVQFLGAEYLLWLWYRSEEFDGAFSLSDGPIELYFDDQLVLEAHLAEAEQSRLKGGAPAYSPEAHKALQLGKHVAKAKLRLVKDEREWLFTIDTSTFLASGVKIPAVLSDEEDNKFYERMYLIEELDRTWYALYRAFLSERLAETWPEVQATIRAWIERPTSDEVSA